MTAAGCMKLGKWTARRSKPVAIRLKCPGLLKHRSIVFRTLYASKSQGTARPRVGLQGITGSAPVSRTRARIALESCALSAGTRTGAGPFNRAVQQGRRDRGVPTPARCQARPQRPAKRIDRHVDFRGQSASRAPRSPVPPFAPFPVAACRCARTRLESREIQALSGALSGSPMRRPKMRSPTPDRAQRVKRPCTVFHVHRLPYAVTPGQITPNDPGRGAPDRRTRKTPFTNRRSSAPLRPGSPTLPGRKGSILGHCDLPGSQCLCIKGSPDR